MSGMHGTILQWNPSITDTLGTQNFVRYNEVSLSQGFWYISGRRGMHNRALSTTWLRFQSFPLLYADRECYPEASTTSNSNESNVKLLTTAAMVDNLAEKVDECPLNQGR